MVGQKLIALKPQTLEKLRLVKSQFFVNEKRWFKSYDGVINYLLDMVMEEWKSKEKK